MKSGLARFWYRFKNHCFRTKPGPREPLRFLCGSEEELRRVTRWACHLNEDVFVTLDEQNHRHVSAMILGSLEFLLPNPCVAITYISSCEFRPDRTRHCRIVNLYSGKGAAQASIERLGEIIYRYNAFTGTEWKQSNPPKLGMTSSGNPVFVCKPLIPKFQIQCASVHVIVSAPSAHERAESLLALSEWLDGKVTPEEKRYLLQLPDDFEF